MHISVVKKLWSFLYPIEIEKFTTANNQTLTVELYRNEFLLTTPNAYYSKGIRYAPFALAFKSIKNKLPQINTFLLLGTGLGSALKMLQDIYTVYPTSTLVDIDKDIITRSKKYMQLNTKNNVTWIVQNATEYICTLHTTFDLIGIDIFDNMHVPYEALSTSFIKNCKQLLTPRGICIFNYLFENDFQRKHVEEILHQTFEHIEVVKHKNNLIYIATNQ